MTLDLAEQSLQIRILEGSLHQLLDMRGKTIPSAELQAYYDVMTAYLRNDLVRLQTAAHYVDSKSYPLLSRISILRFQIRDRSVCETTIKQIIDLAESESDWRAEAYFVCAMAYTHIERHDLAKGLFLSASNCFEEMGAKRKAVKSLLNHLVAESNVNPERKLIVDYHHLAERAKAVGEFGMAGLAFLNISREYHLIGACEIALEYCNRAMELQHNDVGTVHHYLCVVHRAHVLFDLDRNEEATLDLQAASISDFPEVVAAVQALKEIVLARNSVDKDLESNLIPNWRERLEGFRDGNGALDRLTKLENKVVNLLSKRSFTKFELIERIYGTCHDFEAAENRLKVLLSRLRKKRPGLLVFEKSKYKIADRVFLTQLQSASSQ